MRSVSLVSVRDELQLVLLTMFDNIKVVAIWDMYGKMHITKSLYRIVAFVRSCVRRQEVVRGRSRDFDLFGWWIQILIRWPGSLNTEWWFWWSPYSKGMFPISFSRSPRRYISSPTTSHLHHQKCRQSGGHSMLGLVVRLLERLWLMKTKDVGSPIMCAPKRVTSSGKSPDKIQNIYTM